jgi:hypothetical protein
MLAKVDPALPQPLPCKVTRDRNAVRAQATLSGYYTPSGTAAGIPRSATVVQPRDRHVKQIDPTSQEIQREYTIAWAGERDLPKLAIARDILAKDKKLASEFRLDELADRLRLRPANLEARRGSMESAGSQYFFVHLEAWRYCGSAGCAVWIYRYDESGAKEEFPGEMTAKKERGDVGTVDAFIVLESVHNGMYDVCIPTRAEGSIVLTYADSKYVARFVAGRLCR